MNKPFQMTRGMRIGTAVLKFLLRVGVPMGPLKLLSHHGRKTGTLYRTPVALVEHEGTRWLVAAFGEVNWVHNIRATGTAQLSSGWREETIQVCELESKEAAPVLKQFIKLYSLVPFIPPYFKANAQSPLTDFEQDALYHPVFRIDQKQIK